MLLRRSRVLQWILLAIIVALVLVSVNLAIVATAEDAAPSWQQGDATATVNALLTVQAQIVATLTALPATPEPTPDSSEPAVAASQPGTTVVVTKPSVNLREGPGTKYAIVGKASSGTKFTFVDIVNAGTANEWYYVCCVDGQNVWVAGSVATTAAQNTATTAAAQAPVVPAIDRGDSTASSYCASSGALVTDFENFGAWKRGDQAWGTLAQSSESACNGSRSGKFVYDFPAAANNYVVFQRSMPIPGKPTALTLWVNGNGDGSFINAWVQDAANNVWQFTFGRAYHSGWKKMTAPLDIDAGWPNGIVSGDTGAGLAYPVRLSALVVDGAPDDQAISGTIFVDDLYASNASGVVQSDASAAPPVQESEPASSSETEQEAPAAPAQPAAADAANASTVAFDADRTSIAGGECTTLRWDAEGVKALYLRGAGVGDKVGVVGHASREVCPDSTTDYALTIVLPDGAQEVRSVTITVEPSDQQAGVESPSDLAPAESSDCGAPLGGEGVQMGQLAPGDECRYPLDLDITGVGKSLSISVMMTAQSGELEPLVIIYDTEGDEIARSDGGKVEAPASFPGVYTIVATSANGAGGAFAMDVKLVKLQQTIPGTTQLALTCGGKLRYGRTVSDAVFRVGNVCKYTFYAGRSGRVITVRVSPTSGNLEPHLILSDPNKTVEKESDDDIVSYRLHSKGVYTIGVGDVGDDAIGEFNLTLTCNAKCPP